MTEKDRLQHRKMKNTLGDVFDLLRGNTNFINPKRFVEVFSPKIDYQNLTIRLGKDYILRLERIEKPIKEKNHGCNMHENSELA